MPSRILREGINHSQRINGLSEFAELCYRRLLTEADDHGRFWTDIDVLRTVLFPFERLKNPKNGQIRARPTRKRMKSVLDEWRLNELITVYGVDGGYLIVNRFRQQYRRKSKFPEPVDLATDKQTISECYAHSKQVRSLFGFGCECDNINKNDPVTPTKEEPAKPSAPATPSNAPVENIPRGTEVPKNADDAPSTSRVAVKALVEDAAEEIAARSIAKVSGGVLDELKNQLCNLYRRPLTQRWGYAEECQLAEIARRQGALDELKIILTFRRRMQPEERLKFFPGSLPRLLETWAATLDRARMNAPRPTPPRPEPKLAPSMRAITDEERKRMAEALRQIRTGENPEPGNAS
jgi:hypothetical protein